MRANKDEIFQSFKLLEGQVIQEILKPLMAEGTHRSIPPETRVEFDATLVWWVLSGSASLECASREIIEVEAGNIVGTWHHAPYQLVISTAERGTCELLGFSADTLSKQVNRDFKTLQLWSSYQSALLTYFFADYVELKTRSVAPIPQYRRFARGETIIVEGDEGDEVFVLMEGLARVSVNGSPVGEIHQDEVFGALAALTDSVRTATVTAALPCDCMVFSKAEFCDLLRVHPDLMSKLFSDFARALHDLNDSVLRANHTKWRNLF